MSDDAVYSNQGVIEKIQKAFSHPSRKTVEAKPKHQETVQKFVEKLQKAYKKTQARTTQFD